MSSRGRRSEPRVRLRQPRARRPLPDGAVGFVLEPVSGGGTEVTQTWEVLPAYADGFAAEESPGMTLGQRLDFMKAMAEGGATPRSGQAFVVTRAPTFVLQYCRVEIHRSARRHGVPDQDIFHAVEHAMVVEDIGRGPGSMARHRP